MFRTYIHWEGAAFSPEGEVPVSGVGLRRTFIASTPMAPADLPQVASSLTVREAAAQHVGRHTLRDLGFRSANGSPVLVPPGWITVLARARTGKSTALNAMSRVVNVPLKRIGEPDAFFPTESPPFAFAASPPPEALARAVEQALSDGVGLIDSVKDFMQAKGGSFSKGGLSNEIFALINDLSSYLQRYDTVVVASLNPLTSDEQLISELYEKLAGYSTGIANLHGISTLPWGGGNGVRVTLSLRTGSREDQEVWIPIRASDNKNPDDVGMGILLERSSPEVIDGP